MTYSEAFAAHFWERVDKSGECWEWQGARNERGYGYCYVTEAYRVPGRNKKAHRVAYELINGPIPDGLRVCHRCDNPPCVRPDHLFLGTMADNMADRDNKGRHAHGEAIYTAKLNADRVRELRQRYAAGASYRELAAAFGISRAAAYSAARGTSWTHVK